MGLALRRFVVLNTKQFSPDRIAAVTGDRTALIASLAEAGLNQAQRAVFLGVSQSTVSRSARKKSPRGMTQDKAHGQQ